MPTDPELPRLSGTELIRRFGGDEAALRRYRMLAALLREGRPAGEVARTFGVSRESLRRLRHAFQRDGLVALRSRKRGGGHFARGSPLAQAITQELQLDPGVPATRLWRRVQARLREEGHDAPRSTFYRLLAGLRDEDGGAASAGIPIRLLREALGALAEDPPLALGRGALAELLLPDERDPLRRGRQLQGTIHTAIERLRPPEAGPILDDPRWRHYMIIAGEYQTGEERAALAAALALSTSTYSRAKREALERLVALLPVVLNEQPPTPPAALITPPPAPEAFDQEAELDLYTERLRRSGLALIWGPAGVREIDIATMLAARLRARGQQVIWHTCRPPNDQKEAGAHLLLALTAALAIDGRRELWNALNTPTTSDLTRLLELLDVALVGRHWTVIVANTHWLIGEEATRVLDILRAAQQRRDIRLALVGRGLPAWADAEIWPPLPFPGDAHARRAFLARFTGSPPAPRVPDVPDLTAIRERTAELLASLPVEPVASSAAEQILAALHPIEEIMAELRAAQLRPPDTDEGR
ncbi:MAG TPA: helix-turn-helix domain-containing protein [Roseiflexaceae bacterium]